MSARFVSNALSLVFTTGAILQPLWAQTENCSESHYLLPPDGNSVDKAGSGVAVGTTGAGPIAFVGLQGDDDRGANAGAVWTFKLNGTQWVSEQKLYASDPVAEDQFGRAVAISGNFAIVGAYKADISGFADAGAAYVFRHNGTYWTQINKLTAFDPGAGDNYGYSVAIDGNVAVVGSYLDDDLGTSTGAAYVYRYNGTTFQFEKKLLPPKPTVLFGVSVSVSGNMIAGGAYWDNENGSGSGSVSLFRYSNGSWFHEARVLASDGGANDYFGRAVSVSGGILVVGAEGRDDRGFESGAAYVFRNSGSSWNQEAKLLAGDIDAYDRFGSSVAVSGNQILIGSPYAEDRSLTWPRTDQGLAYLYQYQGGASPWAEVERVVAPDGYYYDLFGFSVALSNSTLLVGAPGDARNGSDSGSGYIFGCMTAAAPTVASCWPPDGYVDPREDQDPISGAPLGTTDIAITFSTPVVRSDNAGPLTLNNFDLSYFRGGVAISPTTADVARPGQAPAVSLVSGSGAGPYLIRFSPRIPLGAWTQIKVINVKDQSGNPISYTENRVVLGALPMDIDQDGRTLGADITRWLSIFNDVYNPAPLTELLLLDQRRDGGIFNNDINRAIQLINGTPGSTFRAWGGYDMGPKP